MYSNLEFEASYVNRIFDKLFGDSKQPKKSDDNEALNCAQIINW